MKLGWPLQLGVPSGLRWRGSHIHQILHHGHGGDLTPVPILYHEALCTQKLSYLPPDHSLMGEIYATHWTIWEGGKYMGMTGSEGEIE